MSQPDLVVTPVSTADDVLLRGCCAVETAASALDTPLFPPVVLSDLQGETDDDFSRRFRIAGLVDDEVVATATAEMSLVDNPTLGHGIVVVHPDVRRRGYGRRLLAEVVERLRSEGRTTFQTEAPESLDGELSAGGHFLTALGGERGLVEVMRSLDLPDVTDEQLDRIEDRLREPTAGYEVLTWVGRTPPELADGMAALMARMSTDAPMGTLESEPEEWSAERLAENESRHERLGREWCTAAARHAETGELVAYTDLGRRTVQPETGYQWATLVVRAHRGHSLGMLVKAANLRQARAAMPGLQRILTWNAAVNSHMIAINEAIGFRPTLGYGMWQITF